MAAAAGAPNPLHPPMGWRYFLAWVFFRTLFRVGHCICAYGLRRVPRTGGLLLFSNHQSFYDPMLAAQALSRGVHFMARDTLFKVPLLGWLITGLNAFAVRRASADVAAMKEAVRRLQAGHPLVVFPEGTRTRDGSLGRFHFGSVLLAQRANVPIVPVYIDGAHAVWPRGRTLPRPGPIRIYYGLGLSAEAVQGMDVEDAGALLRDEVVRLQRAARRKRPSTAK